MKDCPLWNCSRNDPIEGKEPSVRPGYGETLADTPRFGCAKRAEKGAGPWDFAGGGAREDSRFTAIFSERVKVVIDKREFRNTLGRFATGVTIVTTVEEGNVHGMTANAFMSVSLEPPLVLVSIDHKAKMHQILPKTRVYGISILRENQEAVSQHFAGRPLEHTPPFFWEENLPFVEHSIAQLACEIVDQHTAGDHTLYIGRVKWLSSDEGGKPLAFFAGKYHKMESKENAG